MSSTQYNCHSTVNKHQRRIPIVSSPRHEQQNMTFFSSSRMQAMQAYTLKLTFINNCVCFDRSHSHAHAFQPVDPISFRFPGKFSQSRKISGRCVLSCTHNCELRKCSDWRISGLVAPLRVVFESRLANQRLRCSAAGRESMTVCLMRGSHFVYNGYSRR